MKTISTKKPRLLRLERVTGDLCDIIFCTNIEPYTVEDDEGEKMTEYKFDMYRLRATYSKNLYDRVMDNITEWLDKARQEELSTLAAEKTAQIRAACQAAIYAGVDVETDNGVEHFSLDAHDQQNLQSINSMIAAGVLKYPYHADGKECIMYRARELKNIIAAANKHITYNTTYCNMLKIWISRETDYETLKGIKYGVPLPADLAEYMKELTGEIKQGG